MPRGRRRKPDSFEEEIAMYDAQIAELTKKLQALKEKRKTRIKAEEDLKNADKWEKIRNSGYSLDQLLEIVNKQKG